MCSFTLPDIIVRFSKFHIIPSMTGTYVAVIIHLSKFKVEQVLKCCKFQQIMRGNNF